MKLKILNIGFLVILLSGLFSACSIKKYIKPDEFLVSKYKLTIENKPDGLKHSELKSFFKPKPNARFLGVHSKLYNYYKAIEKPTKFNKWRDKNFGEYPVMYDDDFADRIKYKMEKYLDNVGFFNSKVSYKVEYAKRTVKLNYTVEPATPYLISEVSYDIPDTLLAGFFYQNIKKTLVKAGDIYNAYTFDDERDRITKDLRDIGYYYFNRNFIQFIVDSAFVEHELTVILKINNIKDQVAGEPGQFVENDHTRYFLKNVDVIPDWKPTSNPVYDTVPHQIKFWNDDKKYDYYFLLDKKKRIKPAAFNSVIKIKPGKPFSATSLEKTYRGLFNFRIIRTATILFDTTGAGKNEAGNYSYINSTIQMQTTKLNSFQAEVEGTNSSGDLGIRGSVVLSNRNIFKRADVFSIRVNGGFEAQSVTSSVEEGSINSLFNTFEAGVSGNFYFPRFLFPGRLTKFNQHYSPITNINFGFNYQLRPNYSRNITNLDLGYSWNHTKQIKHILTPISINYVNINPTPEFDSIIENEPNQRLREQYTDHFIAGLSYSFIYNNQNLQALEHFNYFRADIETSGNLLYGINSLFNSNKNELGYYQIFGVRYAQYIRFNFDYRHYYYFFNKTNSIAVRALFGIGLPYLNSSDMPYEKAFFAGGANGMRGWEFRTLGPGGFGGHSNYERAGDIQIEGNVEYRFPIYKVFKGAVFLDVGNIWTLQKTETFPAGEFTWDHWYQQLAVDAGLGARLDFQFFIFRLDFAIPLVNPAYWEEGSQLRLYYLQWNDFVLNFGIGYPF